MNGNGLDVYAHMGGNPPLVTIADENDIEKIKKIL